MSVLIKDGRNVTAVDDYYADIVIFEPKRKETSSVHNEFTHHMRVDYSAYEGYEIQSWSETLLSRGRIVDQKAYLVTEGGGESIKRARSGKLLR